MLKVLKSSYRQQGVDNVNHGNRWDGGLDFWWCLGMCKEGVRSLILIIYTSSRYCCSNNLLSKVLGANVASFSGLENMDVIAKKRAFHIARKQENREQHGNFQKEVKECVALGRTPKIIIPINDKGEIYGLKLVWQGTMKEVAY